MHNRTKLWTTILAVTMAGVSYAQQQAAPAPEEPQKYYRLDLVLKEVEDGKVINSRTYFTTLRSEKNTHSVIRTGSQIQLPPPAALPQGFVYQPERVSIGVNFDIYFRGDLGDRLGLNLTTELSGLAEGQGGGSERPVIRQNKWSSNALVPFGKPTLIFSSDDPSGKRKIQLEVTAAPIK